MKRKLNINIAIIFLVLCTAILLVVLYRSNSFYKIFPVQASQQKEKIEILNEKKPLQKGQEIHLYYTKPDDKLGKQIESNLKQAMNYAHVHYTDVNINDIENIKPSPYTGIILSGEDIGKFPKKSLQTFVKEGGRLIVTNRMASDSSWNALFGIETNGNFQNVEGLTFDKPLFPGYPEVPKDSNLFTHNSLNVSLSPTTTTWITAENIPIMWTNTYEDGEVLYWNTTALDGKLGRGLFVQSLGSIFPAFTTAQLGAEIMYIDDFPSPIPSGNLQHITKEPITTDEFYKNYWWKDMNSLSEQLGIKYTSVAIGTYENKVQPPFEDFAMEDRNTYLIFGRPLLENGGEIGIHGYNHQPLLLSSDPVDKSLKYVPWETQSDMEKSLIEVQQLVHNFFPNEKLKTYVPPSNIINSTGIQALIKAVPDLQTIASLYAGGKTGGSFIQEFEKDANNPKLYHFPRITSGYLLSVEDQFTLADVAANFGVVSHFVHPDDVLDEKRSENKTWDELFHSYRSMIEDIHKWYPQMQSMTQSEATELIKIFQKGDLSVSYEDNFIHISYKGLPIQSSVVVRVEEGKKLKTGTFPYGTVTKLDEQLYNVKLTKASATIPIKGA
ncbi:DUF2194 domain-containing protein [Bacillus sp. S13(2024)]|uniref:DUF2194 domain-containing protein n=1 Tax=unclassified Bacillus (in: firmicutes) TaxID=185979 RepID=UPI003D19A2D6